MEDDKIPVEATQYQLPDGRPVKGAFMLPRSVAALVREHGFKLSCELIGNGMVATYCQYGPEDEDEECEVTSNGPEVTEKLAAMIRRCVAHAEARE